MNVGSLLVYAVLGASLAPIQGGALPVSMACGAPEYRNFDFWLGDWDVYRVADGVKSAHVRVTSILAGCAIREEYNGVDGSTGESLSSYDPSHQRWQQYWVSSTGEIVYLSGTVSGGAMILSGPEDGANTSMVRGTWRTEATGVRETGMRSRDNGQTWAPWFDLHFRRAPIPSSSTP